ncbi:MAG: glycosyltransferase family protein [Lentisphaerae bacterium]|nr:glycosyltransferase family protein [Lentisphaerota bacterium]
MWRVIILQARMTSTRLPGKVLMDVNGQPMLAQQLRRLKRCMLVDDIVVATTTNATDDPVAGLAHREQVGCFRGSEQDVLARYVGAAREAKADVVVRVTGDCPLIDPQVTDHVIAELTDHAHECDYASNVLRRTYPRGLDVEAFFWDTLLRLDRLARSDAAREHVTIVPRSEHPELFLGRSVEDNQNNADLRWTVDTAADLEFIRQIYAALNLSTCKASYLEILGYVRDHIELARRDEIETWDPSR